MKKKRWNGFAVAGFFISFTNCFLGLVFSCIGIGSASQYEEKGKVLAILGIIISIINMIVTIAAIVLLAMVGVGFVANIGDYIPDDLMNRSRETIIETYAKTQYEDKVFEQEGSKKIKKNASKGYTFTVEEMDNETPGIRELYKSCDLTKSKVIVYPSKPYGKTDYTIKIELDCD